MLALIRHFVGVAKKDAARVLGSAQLTADGGAWAKRWRPPAVRDRRHQRNVFNYIVAHGPRGAAVWTFRDKPQTSKR